MSTTVVFPELPQELVNSDDPTVMIFKSTIENEYAQLVETHNQFEQVRASQQQTKELLDTSDDDAAVQYRDDLDDANAQLETIDEEYQEQIKAFKLAAAERRNAVRKVLAQSAADALAKLNVVTLNGIDPKELATSYELHSNALTKVLKIVKDEVPQVVDFIKALPSGVKQTKVNGSGTQGPRGKTPRLVSVVVNNETIEPATLSAAAKACGIKTVGGRKVLLDRWIAVAGSLDNVSTNPAKPDTFTVTVNNAEQTVVAVAKPYANSDTDEGNSDDN